MIQIVTDFIIRKAKEREYLKVLQGTRVNLEFHGEKNCPSRMKVKTFLGKRK